MLVKRVTPTKTLAKHRFLQMLRALDVGFPDWHYENDPPEVRGDVKRSDS